MGDILERLEGMSPERRQYTLARLVQHLYDAQEWPRLFEVLDAGQYGRAKVQNDFSMRSYMQDLDLGRRAAAWEGWSLKKGIIYLPHLWRYTLLRSSMASRADQYPREAFQLLLLFGEERKAIGLAELLTNPQFKIDILLLIGSHLFEQQDRELEGLQLFKRVFTITETLEDSWRARALRELGTALAQAQQWSEAERVIAAIPNDSDRVRTLSALGTALAQAQQWERLLRLVQHSWLYIETWEEAIDLLSLGYRFISLKTEIEMAFGSAFTWVDNFLSG
jgi:hypothetical protein